MSLHVPLSADDLVLIPSMRDVDAGEYGATESGTGEYGTAESGTAESGTAEYDREAVDHYTRPSESEKY